MSYSPSLSPVLIHSAGTPRNAPNRTKGLPQVSAPSGFGILLGDPFLSVCSVTKKQSKLTPAQIKYLSEYAKDWNVSRAAKAARIHYQTVTNWKMKSPLFVSEIERIHHAAAMELAHEAKKRALKKSDTLLIFLLKSLYPQMFDEGVRRQRVANEALLESAALEPKLEFRFAAEDQDSKNAPPEK